MPVGVTRLVGRTDELRTLARTLTATRDGGGRAVFLVGEPGIGKSRLVAAVRDLAVAGATRVLHGRSAVVGQAIPLRPLRAALLSVAGDLPPADLTALGPYRPALARLVPDWGAPPVADQPREPPDHDLLVLAEGVLRLTGLAGGGRDCLLVLEDLHGADDATLAVLDYLVDNVDRQPTTLLGTLRAEPGPALDLVRAAARRGVCRLVELGRLGPDDLRQLAGAHLDTHPDELPQPAIDLLWAGSGGNPGIAEDALGELVDVGLLRPTPAGWRMARERADAPAALPILTRPVDHLDPRRRELLLLGATLGPAFPLVVLRQAIGRPDRELHDDLADATVARFVRPDGPTADRYRFAHPVLGAALLARLDPAERRGLARRVAEAVATAHPDLPGPHCRTAADLWLRAGEPATAGRLLAEAGRRAVDRGAAEEAVDLLERAVELLADADAARRGAVLETLVHALTEAGAVDRALGHAAALDELADRLEPGRRARLHTALAWAATTAGLTGDARRHVELARTLLGPEAAERDAAPVDVVAAHLANRSDRSEETVGVEAAARRAERVGRTAGLPAVAWRAGLLLGELARPRDPAEATAHLNQAWSVAVRQHVPLWEMHSLVRLGDDDALRTGDLDRLERAHRSAARAGAVHARHEAETRLALHALLQGRFAAADLLTERMLAAGTRRRLPRAARYALLLRATAAAHQGRHRAMTDALLGFRRHGGDAARYAPWIHGLARVFAALLREDRPRALHESQRAARTDRDHPTVCPLAGRHGLDLLLTAVSGADTAPSAGPDPTGRLRWNQQFRLFARAVWHGRAGRGDEATEAVREAVRAAAPYPVARHVGLRLVGEAALTDGWGEPVEWLRTAEEHFHRTGVPAVAAACRSLLRRAGDRPLQRRAGAEDIPVGLRATGVTPREYEVLLLLAGRLSNREIADRLHLSARTVEKHVASLIAKTGQPDRIAVGRLAPTGAPPGAAQV
ncbi:regulatory protein, luxR family [Micromonospora pallida]|uniref:Regulatory protein, luxR family n=1 Tax=Micromonospora pallida TaxID=145854 RepID=A0A1C6S3A2_9ACTN|nr:LuxR family transcriptional regulator [Micromonospora pallida]SCL23879.1 regulatory protein, luxR family [Micromonospora pallida]